jgi:hypothetical protein
MTPAIRFRDLQQRLVILVGCHVALASVAAFEVLTEQYPPNFSSLALIYVAIATTGIVILAGACRGASWARIPLLALCILSLTSCPLSFFAIGILLLLFTGPEPRPLTAAFQRQLATLRFRQRWPDIWLWLFGIVFIYLAVWIFLRA